MQIYIYLQNSASYRFSFFGGTWTLSGYRRFSGVFLFAVGDGTSTTCSVGLVRTVGGISDTGALGKTAGQAWSIVTGGSFSTTGEGKLFGSVTTFPRPGNMWSTCTVRCLCPFCTKYVTAPSLFNTFAWFHLSPPTLKFRTQTFLLPERNEEMSH